ncbi:glycosyltransferase [Rhodopirellula sp. MGV]|uniref:glycosyltransferase n=1 Tax=Rhodopirellula sp. MGV TaxID=2023130 RepID=UPI000B96140F|nr:glycosyltransferase [Rhodopirellula sp. MGV]OYP36055.1 hypothetical protein CGZ80_09920 [Rhodopirellula sp. MGV]PNY36586.1 glycosyl transferase family 2 [Rhodopirellula baltica]
MESLTKSKSPEASVIMTTFRSPKYLFQVLWGFANQSCRDFEIVVGEDGQTDETREVIDVFAAKTNISIQYVTQEHQGFGKTRILNRAIDNARGEYLIFTDGDCVPQSNFVETHLSLATHGRFLSGGCFRLDRPVTDQILDQQLELEQFTDMRWLKDHGHQVSKKWLWIRNRPGLAHFLDMATTTRPTFNGHNSSAWKDDVVYANGFNMEMRYGGLDRELGERLENAGVIGMQIRHRAVCFHLEHERGYVTKEDWQRNHNIRKLVRRRGLTRAEQGLEQIRSSAA